MSIKFSTQISGGQYYADLIIKNIKEEDGSFVTVKNYLELNLICPVPIKDAKTEIAFNKWDKPYHVVIKECAKIAENKYAVAFVIKAANGSGFSLDNSNTIELRLNSPAGNPDLGKDLSSYWKTIVITADKEPSVDSVVEISAAAMADTRLKNKPIDLNFIIGTTKKHISVPVGGSVKKKLFAGKYHIVSQPLIDEDETVEAPVLVAPQEIEVEVGKTKAVHVSYGALKYYGAVDFSITGLPELSLQDFDVTFSVAKEYVHHLHTKQDLVTQLRRLPASGMLEIKIASIILNNKRYDFSIAPVALHNARICVVVNANNVKITDLHHDKSAKLSIHLDTKENFPSKYLKLSLQSAQNYYEFLVEAKAGEQRFSVPVAYGDYQVRCDNFIMNKELYVVEAAEKLAVQAQEVKLALKAARSVSLIVRGFNAEQLTFGACANFEPDNVALFTQAKTYSIFKYAGSGGDGDPDKVLDHDYATMNSIKMARTLENNFKKENNGEDSHKVLPVMVSYTAQLSGGDDAVLKNEKKLKNSLLNYILTLSLLVEAKDEKHPVPGGIIINPDMIGTCMQHKLAPNHPMPVRSVLADVLLEREDLLNKMVKDRPIPDITRHLTDDIKGYIRALNWLTKVFAPEVSYGWQVNVWGIDGGGSEWLYKNTSPKEAAQKVADYVNALGVYDAQFRPDFLAIDRYEADDLTKRSYINSYCYGPREWKRYFDFCGHLSHALKIAIMPWQIPASHTPVRSEDVEDAFDGQHWGTAGTYILGDPKLGNSVENIHPTIRDFSFSKNGAADLAKLVGDTPGLMYSRAGAFNVSKPAYHDFPLHGIFHVQLGGGSTLGMVHPVGGDGVDTKWANEKLAAYDKNPVKFGDTLIKK